MCGETDRLRDQLGTKCSPFVRDHVELLALLFIICVSEMHKNPSITITQTEQDEGKKRTIVTQREQRRNRRNMGGSQLK